MGREAGNIFKRRGPVARVDSPRVLAFPRSSRPLPSGRVCEPEARLHAPRRPAAPCLPPPRGASLRERAASQRARGGRNAAGTRSCIPAAGTGSSCSGVHFIYLIIFVPNITDAPLLPSARSGAHGHWLPAPSAPRGRSFLICTRSVCAPRGLPPPGFPFVSPVSTALGCRTRKAGNFTRESIFLASFRKLDVLPQEGRVPSWE